MDVSTIERPEAVEETAIENKHTAENQEEETECPLPVRQRSSKKTVLWILLSIVGVLLAVIGLAAYGIAAHLGRLQDTINQKEAELTSLNDALQTHQSENAQLQEQLQEQNKQLQEQNETLRSQLELKEQQLNALRTNTAPMVALTFDDGPGPYTERLLDFLKEHQVKATFFVIGKQASRYPNVLKRMEAEGHTIGNHSYSHANLNNLTADGINAEIEQCNQLIRQAVGHDAVVLRTPGGASNQTVRSCAAEAGLPIIYWSVDTRDWSSRNKDKILEVAFGKQGIRDGSIVLMHDIYEPTVEAAEKMIERLIAENYRFVTVPELLAVRRDGAAPGEVYLNGYPARA